MRLAPPAEFATIRRPRVARLLVGCPPARGPSIGVALSALMLLACGGAAVEADEPSPDAHSSGHHAHHGRGMNTEHGHHPGEAHDFSDVDRFATMFDAPERDDWQRPAEVAGLLELASGQTVVDLGAGTGYFVPHLVGPVGVDGRVLALDTEPAMVEHMRTRFEEAGFDNAEPRVIEPTSTGLEPGSVDRVLVVNTWHHLEDRVAYARRLLQTLRPDGLLVVVDFTADAPHGPPPAMRLAPEAVVRELREAGFAAELAEESLPRQYIVRGRASD